MYGADTSIPRKANVDQLVPPEGDEGCDGIVPSAACFQATDVVLVETLNPRSLNNFLYSQLINLKFKNILINIRELLKLMKDKKYNSTNKTFF